MTQTKHKQVEISHDDCPTQIASKYPGIFGRNNPNGSLLSKEDFIECSVKAWVMHFGESEKYENTSLGKKVVYLTQHLKYLKQGFKHRQ